MADQNHDIALMAHLMRRAGFGAQYAELEERAAKGYEATVEELLNPEVNPPPTGWTWTWLSDSSLSGATRPGACRNISRSE